ncbi:MAG: hypothetical protein KKH41_00295 [Candidatus Thermoplasmatota archaeon]|nr:hypothetical protein [Candidatus Thermoplasmatota archaeon]MBU4144752.1 hypothetical protein [Candidatus Thermoplasmatota archaeon]MBU4591003.1 hypothetical protein [Candidatus Thermoplasmatota archaeon]
MKLNNSGVSPTVATVLMVAITVVLAAVLYTGSGHGPTYWNYLGPVCEMDCQIQFNITEFEAFCENNSLQLGTAYQRSAHGQFNLTQGRTVDFRVRSNESYSVTIILEAQFNDSGRISSTSKAEVDRAVAEHYEEDRESFTLEVEYFKGIFTEWFHAEPGNERWYPIVVECCIPFDFGNVVQSRD